MKPPRKSRLCLAMVVVIGAAVTLTLTLYALRTNINLFYTPREILDVKGEAHQLPHVGQRLRSGGDVEVGRTGANGCVSDANATPEVQSGGSAPGAGMFSELRNFPLCLGAGLAWLLSVYPLWAPADRMRA